MWQSYAARNGQLLQRRQLWVLSYRWSIDFLSFTKFSVIGNEIPSLIRILN